MADDREHQIVEAFVDLADNLANEYDPVDLLDRLARTCVAILDVEAAGLLLADKTGQLHVLAASSQAARDVEVFQIQRDEGPCRDCFHSAAPVHVPDLNLATDRWQHFAHRALAEGFVSVDAVPLRLRSRTLGALGLFGTTVGTLSTRDQTLAQALADVASVALIQEHAAADRALVEAQLQSALTSRVAIEQAKGVIAHAGGTDVGEAFALLRRYARDRNLRLADVAAAVIGRRITSREVLDNVRL